MILSVVSEADMNWHPQLVFLDCDEFFLPVFTAVRCRFENIHSSWSDLWHHKFFCKFAFVFRRMIDILLCKQWRDCNLTDEIKYVRGLFVQISLRLPNAVKSTNLYA